MRRQLPVILAFLALAAGRASGGGGVLIVKGWPRPSGCMVGYNLYMAEEEHGKYLRVNPSPITEPSYTVRHVEPGKRYHFKLTSLDCPRSHPLESKPSQGFQITAISEYLSAPGSRTVYFESPDAVSIYTWADEAKGSTLCARLAAPGLPHGRLALQVDADVKPGSWAGAGIGGAPRSLCLSDATGASRLTIWARSRFPGQSFSLGLKEGPNGGGDSESWKSRDLAAARAGEWAKFAFLISEFTEDAQDPDCSPNCLATGNQRIDLNCIQRLHVFLGQTRGMNRIEFMDPRFE